jgi:hypothetical protein
MRRQWTWWLAVSVRVQIRGETRPTLHNRASLWSKSRLRFLCRFRKHGAAV